MKILPKYAIGLFLLTVSFAKAQDLSTQYAETITQDQLREHLTIIASDEMEGRETGTPGQFKAAAYISEHFKNLGLTTISEDEEGKPSYYQYLDLYKKGWTEAYMIVNGKKRTFFKDFYPNGMVNVPDETITEVVFAGYGLKGDSYNDLENIDLKDKGVVVFEDFPKNRNGEAIPISKKEPTFNSDESKAKYYNKKKVDDLKAAGASVIFIISNDNEDVFLNRATERKAVLGRFNRMMLEKAKPAPVTPTPTLVVSKKLASEMLGITSVKMTKINKKISKKASPYRGKAISSSVTFKVKRDQEIVKSMNVLGFMEGTDKKDEVLVITSHYDHIGMNSKGEVYNGADDDGSGTCAVLEIAEAFVEAKKNGNGPRRSILFMTVTGEEKGLLGSRYFTDIAPLIPLDKIMCNLNIDMIGRIDKKHADNDKYIYLIGSDKLSSQLHAVSEKANSDYINFELDYEFNDPKDPNRFYYRSDHYNFAKNNIPVIFYFSGVHKDYHGLGDEVDKILFPKYTQVARLVFHTAWELVHRDQKIIVDSAKK